MLGNFFSNLHELVGSFLNITTRINGNTYLISFIEKSTRYNGILQIEKVRHFGSLLSM